MRLFLTLCSLAAVAYAKPQYNYAAGVSGSSGGGGFSSSGSGLLGAPGVGSFGGSSLGGLSHGGGSSFGGLSHGGGLSFGGLSQGGSSFGGSFGGSSNKFSSGGAGFSSGGAGFSSGGAGFSSGGAGFSSGGHSGFEAPLVHKQFFTIAAPEDSENLERTKHFVIGRPQKNYRVVFIKAPSSSNANVKLSAEYAPQEEKTAIYVLTKKDASLEVNDIATPAPVVPSKPEVFFIKYKTEEEAQHAQRTIQAEYDKIEGTSEHTNGGIGQVQSVVGSLDGGAGAGIGSGIGAGIGDGGSFGVGGGISSGAKSPTYLPPGK